MYTYSVTFSILADAEAEWLDYMHETYLPAIKETGHFVRIILSKIESPAPEDDSVTYHLEMKALLVEHIGFYLSRHTRQICEPHDERFRQRFHAVDACLKYVA